MSKPNGVANSVFDVARAAKKPRAARVELPPIDVTAIKVEKGVAIPEAKRKSGSRYDALLSRLSPNTSAALPVVHQHSLRTAAAAWAKKHEGWEFTLRVVSETDVRIWRTA